MLFDGGFTFANFVTDAFAIFMFILWFWLLMTVASDLFRRHDISGFGKVLWVILLIVLPYIGIFAYILTQGRGMAERNKEQAKLAREHLRQAPWPENTPALPRRERSALASAPTCF